MNVFYSVGFWWGVLVLAVDIGKGMAAMAIAEALIGREIVHFASGMLVVLGHAFPVFLKFRGGKGGASCIGVLVWLMQPWSWPIFGGLFGIIFLITRAPTISYSLTFVSMPLTAWFLFHRWDWVVFSIVLLLVPLIKYIPRIKEMRQKAGSWSRVIRRKSVKERY